MARKNAGKIMILPRGDWDATVAYSTLDLVHIPNAASYLAIKNVPAGTPVSDTNYWQEMSNYEHVIENFILSQDTQPTSEYNRIWLKPSSDDLVLAELADVQEVANDVNDLKSQFNANNVHGDVRFNIWDERWEKGIIDDSTGVNVGANGWRSVGYIPVMPNTEYYLKGSVARVLYYAADMSYIGNSSSVANTTFTTPATARYIRIRSVTSGNPDYGNNICINLSQPDTSLSPHNGDYVSGNTINYVGQKVTKLQADMDQILGTVTVTEQSISREFIPGTYLKQDGTEGAGLSQGTTKFIRFTPNDRAVLRGIVTGNTVYAYAFYDADMTFIPGSSGGNNYTGDLDIPSATVEIPQNTAYVRFSAKTNGASPVAVVFNTQALEAGINANKDEIHGINTVIADTDYVFNTNSPQLTRYPATGYLNNDNGTFVSNANYQCYSFDVHGDTNVWFNDAASNTWLQIAVYNGTMFNADDLVSIGSKGRGTLPVSGSEMHVSKGNKVVVCVYIGENFGLHYSEYALAGHVTESIVKSPIRIRPVTSTQFFVDVLSETTGQYLTHRFIRTVYIDTLEYGSGQSKSVVTEDIWFSDHILDAAGNAIAQGNTNFIQSLDITGHKGHIGAGHGGVVAVWSLFFADGERFDPATLDHEIECSKFRFQTKANHYLRDEANSPSSGHSYPSLDENGDPIIATVQYYDGEWSINNHITARNRLDIVLNQSFSFKQLHAGMCCGFYPYFDNVIVNNAEYVWNQFTKTGSNPDTFSAANMGGTSTVMPCPATSKLGASDEVILFGDNYRLSTRIFCLNPERYGKPNTMVQTPPYTPDNRIKGYLMPCICTDSLIPSGQSAETFSNGDSFDVMVYRAIDMTI